MSRPLHRRIIGLLKRGFHEPVPTIVAVLLRFELCGLASWLSRVWIRLGPNDHRKYYYLASARHRAGRLSEAVEVCAAGMSAQRRSSVKIGAPSGVRYLREPWTHAIGHLALLDVLAKRKRLGLAQERLVILAAGATPANAPYLTLWKDHFDIITDADEAARHAQYVDYLEEYPTVLLIDDTWKSIHEAPNIIQERWDAAGNGPLLSLPSDCEDKARAILAQFGVPKDAWFVTMHIREGTNCLRDADIADYSDAIGAIAGAGGWVIRMGGPSATPAPSADRFLDYASLDQRQEILDVYLLARPRFFLGTNSGPAHAAGTFGTPTLLTNWMPMGLQSWYTQNVTVPKLICAKAGQRALPFSQQLTEPMGVAEYPRMLETRGLTVMPNTPREIVDGVEEMLRRTGGTWTKDADDAERQRRFNMLRAQAGAVGRCSIGRSFLRTYQHLLA